MLILSGPSEHLFIIVTDVCSGGSHLLLSLCSIRNNRHHDPACVLSVDDHEFIKHPSYVDYSKPEQRPATLISQRIATGAYIEKPPVSTSVLHRICEGVEVSEFARPWMVKYFRENDPR